MIPPAEFLPVAQRARLLRELDEWMLRTATREAADWPEHCGHPVGPWPSIWRGCWRATRRSGRP